MAGCPQLSGQGRLRRARGSCGLAWLGSLVVSVVERNHVVVGGMAGAQPMLFAHGYGCDQQMWRHVTPAFEDFQTVCFDHVGAGRSDLSAYDPNRYGTLDGYATDVLEICDALDLREVIYVGHSVAAMIGVLAANREPGRFAKLVLVGPSPRYIDDVDYVGGFSPADIDELLDSLDSNYLGWSQAMAPVIIGNADRPELAAELTESFCRTDPMIAKRFARATFLSDNRVDLGGVSVPTLVLQCREDVIAPQAVGRFVHQSIPNSELVILDATGHCPNLSAPDVTIAAIADFVRR
jgi:sigma-B regulation protein RsbQ